LPGLVPRLNVQRPRRVPISFPREFGWRTDAGLLSARAETPCQNKLLPPTGHATDGYPNSAAPPREPAAELIR